MKLCKVGSKLLDFRELKIMGILNVTPDSFFDGGKHNDISRATERAQRMLLEGADMIDIGAYSSRPGAKEVGVQEEIDRLIPVVEQLLKSNPEIILSIDTFRASVAKEAIHSGAHIINDIGGGNLDEEMFATVAALGVPYILMHSRGNPQTMQTQTSYHNLVDDMVFELSQKVHQLRAIGLKDIIIDPGFGFAKTLEQNYELLARIEEFKILGLPILGALSRKSMIYKALNVHANEALNGTTVLHTILLTKGIDMIRVHDVKEAVEVRKLISRLNSYH